MPDRAPFDARLADAFERYVAPAPVSVNGRAVAAAVVSRRHPPAPWSSARLLALAALLLVALLAVAVIGTGGHLLDRLATTSPSPIASGPIASTPVSPPAPTLAAGAPAWEAIYLRQDPADATKIQVVAVRPDGTERLLRSVPSTPAGATGALSPNGLVARTGGLFFYKTGFESTSDSEITVVDLAAPTTTPPAFVAFDAPVGPRWSTTGLLAVPGYGPGRKPLYEQWSAITILDPRSGHTTSLGSLGLFGGGPSIVWAADGAGILDAGQIKPVDGGADVAIKPDDLFLDRRVGMGRRTVDICEPTTQDSPCPSAAGTKIRVLTVGGGEADWYVATDPNDQPTDVTFAKDGQAILATFERMDGARHTAVIRRLDGPDRIVDLATFDLPTDAFDPGFDLIDPDDSSFAIYYWRGPRTDPSVVSGTILHGDGSAFLAPSGSFAGWVPGPLADSWPAEGSFGPHAPASQLP